MSENILELDKVSKVFKLGEVSLTVLQTVDFRVLKGEFVVIVGPSGTGKTTLLNIAGGLMQATTGEVNILGHSLSKQSEESLARVRNRYVGFIFQMHHLLPEFSAQENVAMPALIAGENKNKVMVRAKARLAEVGLADRWQHRPGELSGGEQQRVAIARALFNEAPLLLADEPTGDLDDKTAEGIHELLLDLNREYNKTLVVVTHNLELAKLADKIVTLKNGNITLDQGEK